jgi:cytochrome c
VNAVAFTPDGTALVTGGHDATLRIVPLDGTTPRIIDLGLPWPGLVVAPDGEIVAGGADGRLRFLAPDGPPRRGRRRRDAHRRGRPLAGRPAHRRGRHPRLRRPRRPGLARRSSGCWSVRACRSGRSPSARLGRTHDRGRRPAGAALARLHRRASRRRRHGAARPTASPASPTIPGAEVFRACSACHTLGRTTATAPARRCTASSAGGSAPRPATTISPALRGMDIVWTKETIARLFEIGPNAYTPGTKMPEQQVTDPDDLKALVDFIAKATGAE